MQLYIWQHKNKGNDNYNLRNQATRQYMKRMNFKIDKKIVVDTFEKAEKHM